MLKKALLLSMVAIMVLAAGDCQAKSRHRKGDVEVADTGDATFQRDVLNSSQPVLVDLYATWCGPCRMMGPYVDTVAKKYKKDLKVFRVDVDKNPRIAQGLNITSVPTFVIYKNGRIVEASVGAMPPERLTAMVERNLQL